ncbi:type IV pilus assembly protein FimV [Roseateles sp. P5_E7]
MPIPAVRPTLLGALTPALALMLGPLLGLVPQGAEAMGLGRPLVHSALGKPLDASVPLSLADGEQLPDNCVRAEVSAGDARVPAGLLQMRVEGEPGQLRIRLQSLVRIDEPALRITLALGCPLRLTREFNAFIDPPASTAAVPAPAPAPVPAAPPAAEPAPPAVAEASPAPVPSARPRVRPKPKASGPRLVLERPEILVSQAPQRPAAKSAPEADMTPELEAQITQLEQTVAQLRAELEARLQAEAVAASAAALTTASAASAPPPEAFASAPTPAASPATRPSPYRDPMTWVLTLGLSLLAGAAAFYGSRWRDERARRELAYWRAMHAAEGAAEPIPAPRPPPPSPGIAPAVFGNAAPLPDEGQHQATRPQPRPMPWPPAPIAPFAPAAPAAAATLPTSMQATQPMPVRAAEAPPPSNELTVADELLDLQQQVDFLQLLGQHEAAADLLAARLSRGNCGAMAYLLLMEICQHRGEPEVFAELVKQFEQRFRTQAPQWSQSLSRGRTLDANPSVIAHLQVVWADPGAAMQMLQDLLSRGSGPGAPHFDLPAYRDLLTLYGVARDLFEAGLRSDDVDLMLPLDSKFDEN